MRYAQDKSYISSEFFGSNANDARGNLTYDASTGFSRQYTLDNEISFAQKSGRGDGNMKVYKSIANNEVMKYFKTIMGRSLMNHASNTCGIEKALAVASVLCPEVVEVKGYIFIAEFYNGDIDSLEEQYNFDRKNIEMWVNSWSLAEFFLQASNESVYIDQIIEEFGKVLTYFWNLRMKELFPEKTVIVEIGDEIMGENGLTITLYQAE